MENVNLYDHLLKNAQWVNLDTESNKPVPVKEPLGLKAAMPMTLAIIAMLVWLLSSFAEAETPLITVEATSSINSFNPEICLDNPKPNPTNTKTSGLLKTSLKTFADTIALVVDSESNHKTSSWEMQLITECVLYKYWINTEGSISITQYLKRDSLHFQGSWDREGRKSTKEFERARKQVVKRITKGTPRSILYYHHTKINGKVSVRGKKRKLALRHIANVWTKAAEGKLKYLLDSTLKHDFFEDLEHKELINSYKKWRKTLR